MPQLHKTTDLKVLAVLGALFYVGIFVGLIGFMVLAIFNTTSHAFPDVMYPDQATSGTVEEAPAKPEPVKKGGLGSEGSVCGGTDRLPCMPGLRCAVSTGESMGICTKASPVDNQPVVK